MFPLRLAGLATLVLLVAPRAVSAQRAAQLAVTPPGALRARPDTQLILARRFAPSRDVETTYDKSRNLTTVKVKPFDPGGGLDLRIAAVYIGHAPRATPASIKFVFHSSAFHWTYGYQHDLVLALPDASILHYVGDWQSKHGTERLSEPNLGPIAIETMTFEIPLADVQHLIQAGSAVGKLGPTEIDLGPRRVQAIADFVRRITPTP